MRMHNSAKILLMLWLWLLPAATAFAQGGRPAWLVGEWKNTGLNESQAFIFESDGTFKSRHVISGFAMSDSGQWRYRDNRLHLVLADDSLAYQLVLAADSLRFTLSAGDLEKPKRFRKQTAPAALSTTQIAKNSLFGRWIHEAAFLRAILTFYPDSNYVFEVRAGRTTTRKQGEYEVAGSQLTLRVRNQKPLLYTIVMTGNRLLLTGGEFEAATTFIRQLGSEQRVAAERRRALALKAQEDDRWRKRFPASTLVKPIPAISSSDSLKDPLPTNIFITPVVFLDPQIYLWTSTYHYRPRNRFGGAELRDRMRWIFFANGRVYLDSHTYDRNTLTVKVRRAWGRYHLEAEDKLWLESDDGERYQLRLEDGRRTLVFNERYHDNVEWRKAKEASGQEN